MVTGHLSMIRSKDRKYHVCELIYIYFKNEPKFRVQNIFKYTINMRINLDSTNSLMKYENRTIYFEEGNGGYDSVFIVFSRMLF